MNTRVVTWMTSMQAGIETCFLLIFGSVVWQFRCTLWPATISGPFPLKDKVIFPCSVCSWYPAQQVAHVGRHCYLSWWHRINWKRSALNLALPGKLWEFCTLQYFILKRQVLCLAGAWGLPVIVTIGSKGKASHKLGQGTEAEENRYTLLTRLICSWRRAFSHQSANK